MPSSPFPCFFRLHEDIRRACPLHPCSLPRSTTTRKEDTDAREHALHNSVCISASLARHAAPYESVVVSGERSVRDIRVLHPAVPRRTFELYHNREARQVFRPRNRVDRPTTGDTTQIRKRVGRRSSAKSEAHDRASSRANAKAPRGTRRDTRPYARDRAES